MARATIKYGNVYLLARRSSSSRSCLVSTILYGLFRGKLMPSRQQYNRVGDKRHIIRYRIYGEKYLVLDQHLVGLTTPAASPIITASTSPWKRSSPAAVTIGPSTLKPSASSTPRDPHTVVNNIDGPTFSAFSGGQGRAFTLCVTFIGRKWPLKL